jgi:hypothetical protein
MSGLNVRGLSPSGGDPKQVARISADGKEVEWGPAMTSEPYEHENPTPTGAAIKILATTDGNTELVIPGMTATGVNPGVSTDVTVNLWISQDRYGTYKYAAARVRSGGVLGPLLYEHRFDPPGDYVDGHRSQWSETFTVTPEHGTIVVTIGTYLGPNGQNAHDVWSDTREFLVVQPEVPLKLGDLHDVDIATDAPEIGDTVSWNGTDWVPAGNERIIVLDAGVSSLPPGSPKNALIVRRTS